MYRFPLKQEKDKKRPDRPENGLKAIFCDHARRYCEATTLHGVTYWTTASRGIECAL